MGFVHGHRESSPQLNQRSMIWVVPRNKRRPQTGSKADGFFTYLSGDDHVILVKAPELGIGLQELEIGFEVVCSPGRTLAPVRPPPILPRVIGSSWR